MVARRFSSSLMCCAPAVIGLEAREPEVACAATWRASRRAGSPRGTPHRLIPTSISTSAGSRTPNAPAASSRSRTFPGSSAHTATSACRASTTNQALLRAPTTSFETEDVPDAPVHHGLGLAHLLAARPDRAPRDLVEGDHRALVRLGVAAEAHGRPPRARRPSGRGCARRRPARPRGPGCRCRRRGLPRRRAGGSSWDRLPGARAHRRGEHLVDEQAHGPRPELARLPLVPDDEERAEVAHVLAKGLDCAGPPRRGRRPATLLSARYSSVTALSGIPGSCLRTSRPRPFVTSGRK